jgi:hypothetical protein
MLTTLDYFVLVVITALTFASSFFTVVDRKSLLQRLMRTYFSEEIWKATASEESHELREFCRDLAMSAATTGGIALAVVAFLMSGAFLNSGLITGTLAASIGVSFILVSAMLIFWAFSEFIIVSTRSTSEQTSSLARGVFRNAFYSLIYGIYFFVVGFVWALSTFNIYFSILYVFAYAIVWLTSILTTPRQQS